MDPYGSFVKEYILDQVTTDSKEFDELFKDIKNLLPLSDAREDMSVAFDLEYEELQKNLRFLKIAWEEQHPGQLFEPRTKFVTD